MYFLIRYDRSSSNLEAELEFVEADRDLAMAMKEQWECDYINRLENVEIVLLEAQSRESLKKSHGRYFESRQALLNDSEEIGRGVPKNTSRGR